MVWEQQTTDPFLRISGAQLTAGDTAVVVMTDHGYPPTTVAHLRKGGCEHVRLNLPTTMHRVKLSLGEDPGACSAGACVQLFGTEMVDVKRPGLRCVRPFHSLCLPSN